MGVLIGSRALLFAALSLPEEIKTADGRTRLAFALSIIGTVVPFIPGVR